jgi:transposase
MVFGAKTCFRVAWVASPDIGYTWHCSVALSEDQAWQEVEVRLGQRLVRVYHLKRDRVRLDSTTVAVYHNEEGTTFFRQGHSKDHRPDLAQFKVMLAALDPLGLPVATLVVPGNKADDPL